MGFGEGLVGHCLLGLGFGGLDGGFSAWGCVEIGGFELGLREKIYRSFHRSSVHNVVQCCYSLISANQYSARLKLRRLYPESHFRLIRYATYGLIAHVGPAWEINRLRG